MAKFHVNPKTGVAGRCRAIFGCPFSDETEHFSTLEEATAAFEAANKHQTLTSIVTTRRPQISSSKLEEYKSLFSKSKEERHAGDRLSFRDGRHDKWQALYKALRGTPYGRALDVYYGEEASERINRFLRDPSSDALSSQGSEAELAYYETIDFLDSYIRSMSRRASPELLYKGATVDSKIAYGTLRRELSQLQPGAVLYFPGFTSTSLSAASAENFMRGKGVLYEIHSSKGAFMNEGVEEVLLARNSKFIFVGYEELDNALLVRLKQED